MPKAPFNICWHIVLDQPTTFVESQLLLSLSVSLIDILTICSKSSTSNTSSCRYENEKTRGTMKVSKLTKVFYARVREFVMYTTNNVKFSMTRTHEQITTFTYHLIILSLVSYLIMQSLTLGYFVYGKELSLLMY